MRRRQNAFRKNWLPLEQRQLHAGVWAQLFCRWKTDFERGQLSGPEFCARVIDQVWRDLFPKNWCNGSRNTDPDQKDAALGEFLRRRYRGLPEAVPLSLQAWAESRYPLNLYFHSLSVDEVLKLQSQGRRCVSLMIQQSDIVSFRHEDRDFLSFLIHDLIHAHHLMKNNIDLKRQTLFAQWMWNFRRNLRLDQLLQPPQWQDRFDYIAADMNSHLIHLLKTLKALDDEVEDSLFTRKLRDSFDDIAPESDKFWELWKGLNHQAETADLHLQLLAAWDGQTAAGSWRERTEVSLR